MGPMGPHGVPMGSHGVPWGPHGVPMGPVLWVPMDPRISKIMDFNETHYSVRQKIGDGKPISTQNINPLHSVVSKRPESPYGAKNKKNAENRVFSVFLFFGPIGSLMK